MIFNMSKLYEPQWRYIMNKKQLLLLTLIFSPIAFTGCASNLQGDVYSREDARQVQTVQYGTIEAVTMVVIEGTKTPIGTAAGAAVGGIAGSSVGSGKGAAVAAVIGAVAGGLAGSAAEEGLTKRQGVELVVRLNNSDRVISVIQQYDAKKPFNIGDRVRVLQVNGQTRISQ
jgi:outer membrane lipoprotein SlyB